MPDTEVLIVTFTATHIIPTFTNLSATVNAVHVSDSPRLHRDKQLEEFLIGEICCHNFINQDLTFWQPSTIHETKTKEDSMSPESNPTEAPLNTSQETNQPQEEDSNLSQTFSAELSYNRTRITNRPAPIQPVEPVVGLTLDEQCRKEEDPDLTLDELLGLASCEDHISTPPQTLNGLYVNQSSQYLPLAQES